MNDYSVYNNPLITRYATRDMSENFSDLKRAKLFRQLWIVLAESEKELGLNITDAQIDEMKGAKDDIDFEKINEYEKIFRHDVMASIHAFSVQAPSAKPIIHLGATSCYVTDNADIMIYADAINLVETALVNVMDKLKTFALKYKSTACLGYTHLQPAQLTTVGKRATLYLMDLLLDYENLQNLKKSLRLRGVKGTTGTQASFLDLFDNDEKKVFALEKLVAEKLGFEKCFEVTGQTYTRKLDYNILSVLSGIAQSATKFSCDLRILQSFKEVEEPFEKTQVGSSAMAYKRNPMRSERMGSIARFVLSLPINSAITSSTQWFERTLDDSANRRIVMAQAFLGISGVLNLYANIAENMVVYENVIKKRVQSELPFMATENIIMEAVKKGGDRQALHERIRVLSMQASKRVKEEGLDNNLIELIKADKEINIDNLDDVLDSSKYIGLSVRQVQNFINDSIEPILKEHSNRLGQTSVVEI